MKLPTLFALALTMASTVQTVNAAPVEARFTATVFATAPDSGLPGVDSIIRGTITFDNDPGQHASYTCFDGTCAGYDDVSPYQFSVDLGTSLLSTPGTGVAVYDNSSIVNPSRSALDGFDVFASVNNVRYLLQLAGPSSSFDGTALPSLQTLNNFWDSGIFVISTSSFSSRFQPPLLQANITSFTVSAVPEPTTVALFGLGLGALWIRSRRQPGALQRSSNA